MMKFKALTAAALTLCLLTGCGGGDEANLDPNDLYGNDDSDGTPGELP